MADNARKTRRHLHLLHAARDAAARAGDFLRHAPAPGAREWHTKGARDFVSHIDREAERIIRETLLRFEPDSHVVGEELAPALVDAPLAWIVDPLDGTTNYLHRFPAFGVSIAAAIDGEVVAGVVLDVPRRRECYAALGTGAWCQGAALRVSEIDDPEQSLIGTGYPFRDLSSLEQYLNEFRAVARATAGIRRAGSAALDLCSVASGEFEAFWEHQLAPWDIAAGMIIVREAGGVVTDFAGNPAGLGSGPVLAGNPRMHDWLLTVIAEERGAAPRTGPS